MMSESSDRIDRSAFLKRLGGLFAIALIDRDMPVAFAPRRDHSSDHPDPRPGITADHVLKPDDLTAWSKKKDVGLAYDAAREFPEVFDGIACGCGCHGQKDYQHRSLLVCYEGKQPTGCAACQEYAIFIGKQAKERKTLDEIRAAFDKKFG
jgi:hypothetical protein